MTVVIVLQCAKCKNGLRWKVTGENFPGTYICKQYPRGIPKYVEEATRDCPKFEEKEGRRK